MGLTDDIPLLQLSHGERCAYKGEENPTSRMEQAAVPREPFKLKFNRPAAMLLFSNAICDPPLGQSTVVPYEQQTVISCWEALMAPDKS